MPRLLLLLTRFILNPTSEQCLTFTKKVDHCVEHPCALGRGRKGSNGINKMCTSNVKLSVVLYNMSLPPRYY